LLFWILAIWATCILSALFWIMPETCKPNQRHPIHLGRIFSQYFAVLLNGSFITHTLTFCTIFGGMIAWIAAGPFLVIETFHYSVLWFGIFQAMIFACFILGTRMINRLIHKIKIEKMIRLGLNVSLLAGLGFILVSLWLPKNLISFIIILMLYAAGSGV